MLRSTERYWASKARLLRLLADLEASDWCRQTVYLRPTSTQSRPLQGLASSLDPYRDLVSHVLQQVGESETGLVFFLGDERAVVVAPPFPMGADVQVQGADTSRLVALLNADLLIGVVLLRLGRYAVGVLRGERLMASKTGARYVKSRHRAGGSSQRRFERSRERLVRELFDKTCQVVRDVFSPYAEGMDYFLIGGERHTLRGFVQRCRYLRDLEQKMLSRVLPVDRPGQEALSRTAFEVWKSHVVVFDRESQA